MPRLDYFLDNDTLKPAKERAIRRLVNYSIKKEDDQILLTYTFIDFHGETSKFKLEFESLEELRLKAYRQIMTHLIKTYNKYITLTIARVALRTILERGTIQPSDRTTWLDDKDGSSHRIPEFKNIRIDVLFKAVEIIKKEEVIFEKA